MDIRKAAKMLYILSAASLVLPWFTYNADIMGYCFGSEFYVFFIIPMLMVWYMLYGNGPGWLGLLGVLMNLTVLVYALGGWMRLHNITSVYMLKEGIHTAVSGFWVSCILFISLLAAVAADVLTENHNTEGEDFACC